MWNFEKWNIIPPNAKPEMDTISLFSHKVHMILLFSHTASNGHGQGWFFYTMQLVEIWKIGV